MQIALAPRSSKTVKDDDDEDCFLQIENKGKNQLIAQLGVEGSPGGRLRDSRGIAEGAVQRLELVTQSRHMD